MISRTWRPNVQLAALCAVLLLTLLASLAWPDVGAANSQRALSVSAYPTAIPARGGESTITVRISADAAGSASHVNLSTELGAFTATSGSPEIRIRLDDLGNDMLGASVKLFADGRTGATVVRAQVGSVVDTVTIRFVGETTSLRVDQPAQNARLDASTTHRIRVVATDETGAVAPSAEIRLELVSPPEGALLRSGATSSTSSITVDTNQRGEATVLLSSGPGDVTILATSGSASLTIEYQLYGRPTELHLLSLAGSAIEAGKINPGAIQANLLDEQGNGVPHERISFRAGGGLVVSWEDERESVRSDDSGRVRVDLDSRNARLGDWRVTATWESDGRMLRDELEIRVTGEPVALYLRAQAWFAQIEELLIEEYASSTRYRVQAEVLDRRGQRVAGAYQVRWRPLISEAGAQVYPQVSTTQNGVATAIYDLQHVDGKPQIESTWAQAWLIAKAQVNNNGAIADLLGTGEPLRAGWNDLTWEGPDTTASEAVEPIAHLVSAAWRITESGGWQAWFTANVPGAVDFTLKTGDSFYLVLRSAALLENVKRR